MSGTIRDLVKFVDLSLLCHISESRVSALTFTTSFLYYVSLDDINGVDRVFITGTESFGEG